MFVNFKPLTLELPLPDPPATVAADKSHTGEAVLVHTLSHHERRARVLVLRAYLSLYGGGKHADTGSREERSFLSVYSQHTQMTTLGRESRDPILSGEPSAVSHLKHTHLVNSVENIHGRWRPHGVHSLLFVSSRRARLTALRKISLDMILLS